MSRHLIDLWHDLREKRLAAVAILLALALVAVPVLLAEHAEEPTPPSEATNAVTPGGAAILPATAVGEKGSDLNTFDPTDPFRSPTGRRSPRSGAVQPILPPSQPTKDSSGDGGPGTSAGGETPGAGAGGAPSPGGGAGGETTSRPPTRRRTAYVYVADVTFGRPGSERRTRGLRRLEMLPSSDSPLLVFLGATQGDGDAVFLVDSSLRQAGEGRCADKACSILSIGPGSEHRFRDDRGREYRLRIDRIRRVRVGGSASSSRASASSARTSRSRDERRRGLVSSLLVDVETGLGGQPQAASAGR